MKKKEELSMEEEREEMCPQSTDGKHIVWLFGPDGAMSV